MNPIQITSADVKKMARLVEQREALQAQVAKIDAELTSIESRKAAAPAAPAKAKPDRHPPQPADVNTGDRGGRKAAIIELLAAAGASGLSVPDIAAKLKAKPGNVHVWFSSTGKTVKEIKKLGPGKYGWAAAAEPMAAPAAAGELLPISRRAHLLEAAPAVAMKAEKPVVPKVPVQAPNLKGAGATKDEILNWLRAPEDQTSRRTWVAGKLGVKP